MKLFTKSDLLPQMSFEGVGINTRKKSRTGIWQGLVCIVVACMLFPVVSTAQTIQTSDLLFKTSGGSETAYVCGAINVYDNGGSGSNYANNQDYTVVFRPGAYGSNAKLRISFSQLSTENNWDFVYVTTNGSTATSYTRTNIPPTTTSTAADGSITVRFTSDGSTVSAGFRAIVQTITNPTNLVSGISGGGTVCKNAASPTITASTSISVTSLLPNYQWYSNAVNNNTTGSAIGGASGTMSSGSVSYNPSTATVGTIYYYCIFTDKCGTSNTSSTIAVTVNEATANAGGALSAICQGGTTAALGGSVGGVATGGVWSDGGAGGSFANNGGATPGAATYTASASAPASVTLTLNTTGGSCSAAANKSLTVNPNPTVNVGGAVAAICQGGTTATLGGAFGGGATSAVWSDGGAGGSFTNNTGTTPNTTTYTASASAPSSVTLRLTTGGGSCGTTFASKSLTVNPNPVVNVGGAVTAICQGGTTAALGGSFSGGATSAVWSASPNTGSFTNNTGSTPGTTTYTASASSASPILLTLTTAGGSCGTTSANKSVTVNPLPIVDPVSPSVICSGTNTSINLSANLGVTGYSWTVGAGSGSTINGASAGSSPTSITQALTNTSNVLPGSVVYSVTATSTIGSCVGPVRTITQSVNPAPAVTTAAPGAICDGGSTSFVLTATMPSTYAWTQTSSPEISGASAGTGNENDVVVQVLTNSDNAAAHNTVYHVVPTSVGTGCAGASADVTQVVNPTPAVTTAAPAAICDGANTAITLTGSVASTYTWTVTADAEITGASNGSGNENNVISQALSNSDDAVAHNVVYRIQPTSTGGSCVGVAVNRTQVVNPTPSVTTNTPSAICSGANTSITLISSAAATYTWTVTADAQISGASNGSGNENDIISQALTNSDNAAPHNVVYHIQAVSAGGTCIGSVVDITQVVNPTPVVTTAAPAAICDGANTSIALTSSVASTYTWTVTADAQIGGASNGSGSENDVIGQTLTNSDDAAAHNVVYRIQPTSTVGSCTGVAVNRTQAVNPTPSVTTAVPSAICSGANTSIALTSTAAATYTWTVTADAQISGASNGSGTENDIISQALTNSDNAAAHNVIYRIQPVSAGGTCVGLVVNRTQVVNPTPAVTTTTPAAICDGANTAIALTGSVGSTYTWTVTADAQISGASNGSGNENDIISQALANSDDAAAHNVVYQIQPTSTVGCVGLTVNRTQVVNPSPSVTTAAPSAICSGTNTSITLTSSAPATYTWTVTADAQISGASNGSGTENDIISQSLTNSDNAIAHNVVYHIRPVSTGGTCAGAVVDITQVVNPAPVATTAAPAAICDGANTSITLTGSVASTYTWTVTADAQISGASNGSGTENDVISQALSNSDNAAAHNVVYRIQATSVSSCVGPVSNITQVVNPTPSLTNAGTGITCSGVSPNISLTATVPSDFAWTIGAITGGITGASASSGATLGQVLTNPSGVTPGSVVYEVTPTSTNGCIGSQSDITLTVNAAPSAIGGNGPVCGVAQTINLTQTALGGTWTSANTDVATVDINTGEVTSTGSGTSVVTYRNGPAGCFVTALVTVNPRPVPTFSAQPGAVSCAGSNVTYTTQPGQSNYVWSVPGSPVTDYNIISGGISSSDNTVTIEWVSTGSKTVTVGYTNPITFCTPVSPASNTTVVGALPAAVVVTDNDLPIGGPYCGSTTLLATNGNDGLIYFQNTVSNGTSTLTQVSSQLITNSGATPFTRTYYFRAQSAVGCWGPQGSLNVTVNPNPIPQTVTVTDGGIYCTGGTGVTVGIANSQVGVNYQLLIDGTPEGAPIAGNAGSRSFGLQTVVSNDYRVVATNTTTFCTSEMANTVSVSVVPVPTVYAFSGGGGYCAGDAGISNLVLSNSQVGITYRLMNGLSQVGSDIAGTGGPLNFAVEQGVAGYTAPGNYTVIGNPTSTCATTMAGVATISVNPAPGVFVFTGTATICAGDAGVTMYLSGSQSGVNYQLFRDGAAVGVPKPGTGFMLTFTGLTTAGTYSVLAQHGTSLCENAMTGTPVLTVLPQPTNYIVSGTGSYCMGGAGVDVMLSGTDVNVDYTLYRNGVPTGTVFSGNGSAHTFAGQTQAGTYTVGATNTITNCTRVMSGSATVTINALPAIYSVSGGGGYCQGATGGVALGMGFSSTSASYTLYGPSGLADGPLTGTGAAFSFANQTTLGSYTVIATSTLGGCTAQMNGHPVVSVNPLPVQFNISAGGSYCIGGTGVNISLDGSQGGVNYQLYRGAAVAGTTVTGTGSAIDMGLQTATGNNYIIVATSISTLCSNTMSGVATVTVTPLPTAYAMTGTGSACAGAGGVVVAIANTQNGVNYELYRNGVATGTIINGNGAGQDFGAQLTSGSYTAVATNTLTLCTNNMSGSATVTINPLPGNYAVTGGGTICSGGTGVNIGLAGSESGVEYRLYIDGVPTGSPVAGTGFALSFGTYNTNGAYTVGARNTTTNCTFIMGNSVNVSANPLPVAQAMTGGGSYCPGGTGVLVGLAGSEVGVTYALYLNGNPTGITQLGAGVAFDFGLQTATGIYTVGATSGAGCTATMTGSRTVSLYALPTIYTVTGGGGYCPAGAGVVVGLNGSQSGVNYQLVLDGVDVGGALLGGTGTALSYGLRTDVGTYTVRATNANGCSQMMNNTAPVSIYDLPIAYTLSGSGSYCAGGTGIAMTLSGSQIGVNYQLFRVGSPVGSPVGGSGFALALGSQTLDGTYTMSAINTTTGCVNNMNGIATVVTNALPVVYAVGGGGSYCLGGAGVDILLSNTEANVNYTLLRNGISTGVVYNSAGTGAHTFTGQTLAGVYTVAAINAGTGCTNNMSGNATVSINSLPTQYAVTGGGNYCVGGTGVAIGLNSTNTGISYQLRNEGGNVGLLMAGTGSSISFGLQTTVGSYSVLATNTTTGCMQDMNNAVSVGTNPLPTAFAVSATNGGLYCAGGTGVNILLSGSQAGVNYQLYAGSTPSGGAIAGTGAGLDFGLHTAGTYSVSATNATTTCTNNMTGGATVATTPLPTAYNVTGTGSYCAGGTGVALGLDGSENNFQYQLYRGATLVTTVTGTGAAISFGNQTTGGTYTVLATNNITNCQKVMSGNATVTVDALPLVHAMNGGGAYCATGTGVNVGLSSSTTGISYQLYNTSGAAGSAVVGTGSAIGFGLQTTAGSYTVVATNTTTGCVNTMSGNSVVTINALPVVYNMTGGGGYCQGGTGMPVGLSGSELGITYQLYIDGIASGTPAIGTGTNLNFGIRTIAGAYTIIANTTSTGCTIAMNGAATISVNPLPNPHAMTGGGSYCIGGAGVAVGLATSQTGIDYQLYNGGVAIGSPVAGTGASIAFGPIAAAGTYTVLATDATSGCTRTMNGSATVTINPLPVAFAVSGGGAYCQGGIGVHVGMIGTEFGMSYQLYHNGTPSGSAVTGTGAAIDFGFRTAAGTYTVKATNPSTSCVNDMSGSVVITINSLPAVYTVNGGGAYCQGGAGIAVGLNNSSTGVSYQLFNGSTATGGAVNGTGTSFSFGLQTSAGTYTVQATDGSTGCKSDMNSSVVVTINSLPTVYNMTGGGAYCQGGTGVAVGISGSQIGISYQLYNNGGAVGTLVPGTGSAINFGVQTAAGTYSVTASNMPTGCMSNMNGNATISINSLPTVFDVTGGGANCAGAGGVAVTLSGSQSGVSYQLYNGSAAVGGPVAGTGAGLSLGMQTTAGTYSVSARNASTTCYSDMNGGVTVTINPLPAVQSVVGGGSLCQGAAGVTVGLATTENGIQYELYRGSTQVTTMTGTGGAINFAVQSVAGTYSVLARNTTTTCTQNMLGNAVVTVNTLPTAFSVTGGVSSYCQGGAGIAVGLTSSEAGVSYQLYNGNSATGTAVAGTGGAISFGNQLTAGTYSVTAINGTTGCRNGMTGSSTISINPLPTIYPIVGGGSYCQGDAGVNISLGGTQAGITYILNQNGNPIATLPGGGAVDFGAQAAGNYTISGVSGFSCTSQMSGIAVVVMNNLPTVYDVTGGGSYCQGGAGVSLGLSNSQTGVSYQLLANNVPSGLPVAGTGFGLSFGTRLAASNYTVRATNSTTGCTTMMNLTQSIVINSLPTVYDVTGGGSFCQGGAGVSVGLSSSDLDVTYDLYNNAGLVTSQIGTTFAIDFGMLPMGNYTVKATNLNSCVSNMNGTATVTENALPTVYAITGGGSYCQGLSGVAVGLVNSQSGVTYQLYSVAGAAGSVVAGTGAAISFGDQTTAGNYTVVATNSTTGCTQQMSGTAFVNINTPPTVFSVTGGGSYCQGTGGLILGTSGSEMGISYQLYNNTNPVGAAIAGNSSPLSFGAQTAAGNYAVVATNTTTGCVSTMNGTSVVTVNSLPTAYNIGSSASSYCAGSGGVAIALSGSDLNISYQLMVGGAPTGAPEAGTGSNIDFGLHMAPGMYTVQATDNTTGCTNMMSTPVNISINQLPIALPVSGGGSYCQGGTGVHVGMSVTENGIRYDLYNGSMQMGTAIGNGNAVDFGLMTDAGTYYVIATNVSTTCTKLMPGTAVVGINNLPAAYAMNLGGSYCEGGVGIEVKLTNSETGVSYQLYNGGIATGSPVGGTGSQLSFGVKTAPGVYTAIATNMTTGCTADMSASSTVVLNAAPLAYTITGGGGYCSGGAGVNVGLSNSQAGVRYQLYNGGIATGTVMTGTGAAIDFGLQATAGIYKVSATNIATGCGSEMTGTAVVSVNSLPNLYNVAGGGSYCSGTPAPHVTLSSSQLGMQYQLYRGATAVGTAVAGTGSSIDFGAQSVPGVYSAYATNATTTCNANMNGSVTITMNTTVVPDVTVLVSPNDTVCAGTNVMYTALATNGGSTPTFEWKVNGFSVGISSTYNYVPTDGDLVTLTMTSSAVCATPATVNGQVTMTVKANVTPQVTVTKNTADTICAGTVVTYTANPLHGGTPSYLWLLNGSTTTSTGSSWMYAPSQGDVVTAVMTSTDACASTATAFSNPVTVEVENAVTPIVVITADPGTDIAKGTSVTLTAAVSGGGLLPMYQWYLNGAVVPGATLPTFTNSNYNNMDSVTCVVTANSACGERSSFNSVIMHVEGGVSVTNVTSNNSDLRLLPNPNRGTFTVKGTLGTTANEEVTYEMTNMLGQVVYKARSVAKNGVVDEQIQLPNVANGMYMLTLKTTTENKVFHVVVEQ